MGKDQNCGEGGNARMRRENNKIVEEGIKEEKTMRKENNKIVEEEKNKNIKRERGKKNIVRCVKKDSLPSLTILIESLI